MTQHVRTFFMPGSLKKGAPSLRIYMGMRWLCYKTTFENWMLGCYKVWEVFRVQKGFLVGIYIHIY